MLEIRGLAFGYPGRPVLRDVTFEVSPGEVVGIIGDNGVGKTTLLRVLATLAVPDRGTVLRDGHDVFADPFAFRRLIGYLPETPALYEDMTVKDYLRFRAYLKGETGKRVRHRVTDAAELCGILALLRSPIRRLSLGQRRRVALADAILVRPRLLLLDDFLAGLDTGSRLHAGELFAEAASFSSVIVTGHELDDLARVVTRFLVLRDGTVASVLEAAGLEPAELADRARAVIAGGAS